MPEFKYQGTELDLFATARNWKTYWSQWIRPFIAGDVLEVGAGLGSNTPFLDPEGTTRRWLCLEPDRLLVDRLAASLSALADHRRYEIACGTISTLDERQQFDTIIYIDVLEHIEDDGQELRTAAQHLRPGGRLISLSPAHHWLFSPFDVAVGHVRRYDRSTLESISTSNLRLDRIAYLDSAGLACSVANLLILRQSMPTPAQVRWWDRRLVPLSRVMDRILRYSLGKSIVAIWNKG